MRFTVLLSAVVALIVLIAHPALAGPPTTCTSIKNADGSVTYTCPQGVTPSAETAPAPDAKPLVAVKSTIASHLTRIGFFQSTSSNQRGVFWTGVPTRSGIDLDALVLTNDTSTIRHNRVANVQRQYKLAFGPMLRIGNTNTVCGPRWELVGRNFTGKAQLGCGYRF